MTDCFYRLTAILATLLIALSAAMSVAADDYVDPYKDYDEFLFFDYDLDRNIDTPAVGKKEHKAVSAYINRMKEQLKGTYGKNKNGCAMDLMRDNEVLIVTLPTDELFLPNDTLLTPHGVGLIKPLLPYMQDPDMFKIVYTVHTDDSGSPSYLEHLAEARSNSFYGWLLTQVPEDLIIISYPMADEDNLYPNDSRKNRAENRRIELYFIPGPRMIQLAHEGKLK